MHSLTLLLTILGALLVQRGLVGQTGQRLFNLTCNVFLVHLQRFLIATAILLFLGVLLSGLVDGLLHGLVGFGIDVNTLLAYAYTLFALALLLTLLLGLLLALLALLLLRLLLGTSALVEGVEVDLALYLQLRSIHDLLLALQLEHFGFFSLLSFHIGRLHLFLRILLLLRFSCRFLLLRLRLGAFRLDLNRLLLFSGRVLLLGSGLRGLLLLRLLGFLSLLRRRLFLNRLFNLGFGSLHLSRLFLLLLHFLSGRSLFLRLRLLSLSRLLAQHVKVDLAQRLVLLLVGRLQKALGATFRGGLCGFLLLVLLGEKLVGLVAHLLVLLESSHQSLVLSVVDLEARLGLHFSQLAFLFQELHSRLKSNVQFS